jgi:excisionase family DNA binding protein
MYVVTPNHIEDATMNASFSITQFPSSHASIDDAAILTRSSRATVNRMLADGRLPAVKHGHRTLIPVAAIQTYLSRLPVAQFRAPVAIRTRT